MHLTSSNHALDEPQDETHSDTQMSKARRKEIKRENFKPLLCTGLFCAAGHLGGGDVSVYVYNRHETCIFQNSSLAPARAKSDYLILPTCWGIYSTVADEEIRERLQCYDDM